VDLSYIIIAYNDAAKLPGCLSSCALAAVSSGLSFEIIVVDNGSGDETPRVLESYHKVLGSRLAVIRLERNTGTTYSRNRALQRAQGKYLCILDSDAELLDKDLRPVLGLLDEFPELGIVGPRIIMPDGTTYHSAKRLPTLGDKLLKLPHICLALPPINRDFYPGFPFTRVCCVQTVISCCWFLRREVAERIGPLDERIFYAPEDVDYCLRSWLNGLAVVYFPYLRILHHTKQVTHKRPLSPTALSHLRGLFYYWHKHRYLFSRRHLVKKWVNPLARRLDPLLGAWQAKP